MPQAATQVRTLHCFISLRSKERALRLLFGNGAGSTGVVFMSCAEGWDPDRWDTLDILQPSGQVIRTERSSSARSSSAPLIEKDQADEKVITYSLCS